MATHTLSPGPQAGQSRCTIGNALVAEFARIRAGGAGAPELWRVRLRRVVAVLSVTLLTAAVVGCRSGSVPVAGDGQAAASVAPEPPAPPPPFSPALASLAPDAADPAADAAADAAQQITAAIAAAETVLTSLPMPGQAPPELIVAPGLQRAAVQKDVPPHERWEIEFPPGNTIESYTRQLDYFGIELGLVGGSRQITYLVNLSDPAPQSRTAPAADEERLYLVWARGAMREADQQLITRAKLNSSGKTVVHFLPPQIEAELLRLEEAEAARRNLRRVTKTQFGIRSNGFGGFQFYVVEQQGGR
jgi:hypothetical protein